MNNVSAWGTNSNVHPMCAGLRSGGGDWLAMRPWEDRKFLWRFLYDQLFFIIVILILMNILFGIIIDTFGDLRQERQGLLRILPYVLLSHTVRSPSLHTRTLLFSVTNADLETNVHG